MKYIVTVNNNIVIKTVDWDIDDSFSKEIEQEKDEVYFREKLGSSIKLKGADYDFIYNSDIQTKFLLNITQVITENNPIENIDYFNGYFTKLDCEFNNDDKIVEITVSSNDMYEDLLLGIDDEYDLIKLAPPTKKVQYFKRPIIQIYRNGDDKLTNFLGGTFWEEDCTNNISDYDLVNTFGFTMNNRICKINLSNNNNIPAYLITDYYCLFDEIQIQTYNTTNPDYTTAHHTIKTLSGYGDNELGNQIFFTWDYHKIVSDDYIPAVTTITGSITINVIDNSTEISIPYTFISNSNITDEPTYTKIAWCEGNNGEGGLSMALSALKNTFSRLLSPKNIAGSIARPQQDITEFNLNYTRIIKINYRNVYISTRSSIDATEYGAKDNGEYYIQPNELIKYYPISRSTWDNYSLWFSFDEDYIIDEQNYLYPVILKDAYTLEDTIQVLLDKILGSRKITFANTDTFSQFFYSQTPILLYDILTQTQQPKPIYYPILTPKSNILKGEYDKPAQKAPITLKEVFDMLKTVFSCYWQLEKVGNNINLRIEHISYFQNGGSYGLNPSTIGVDLTTQFNTKSQRPYAVKMADYISGKDYPINANKWKYDKSDLPTRTEYSWMDNSSEAFNGYPIVVNSPNVTKGKIDKIQSAKFTTDIDMMVSTSEEFSSDGFALMGAEIVYGQSYQYKLPIINIQANRMNLYLQNGYLAYVYLHPHYFIYNAPAPNITINESEIQAVTTIKTMQQEIEYPYIYDLDYKKIIRTGIGDGVIQKISVNLSNRNNLVTLKFNED